MIRRTIPELVTKYRLEPTIRDVYVEGTSDRRILAWFLKRAGRQDVGVFEVDFVEVPAGLVSQYGLSDGNRQRVLTLASEIEKGVGAGGS